MNDIEPVYEAIAQGIDAAGRDKAEVYLAKVALALAHALDDTPRAISIALECRADLDR